MEPKWQAERKPRYPMLHQWALGPIRSQASIAGESHTFTKGDHQEMEGGWCYIRDRGVGGRCQGCPVKLLLDGSVISMV